VLSGNLTLNGGTANGVLYLNGSKVATSGTALVFDGTNLGIGTASPANKLDVQGSATDFVAFNGLNTNNNAGTITSSAIKFGFTSTVGTHYATLKITEDSVNSNSGGLTISLPNGGVETPLLALTSAGNLGIGTTSPAVGLSVQKDNGSGYVALFRKSASDPALTIQTTSGITQIQGLNSALSATNDIAFQLSGGNLGIGTASPAQKLEVSGNQRFTGSQVGTKIENRNTGINVSTATTILDEAGAEGRVVIVNGANGGDRFCDLVFCSTAANPTVIASFTAFGTPTARTYTRNGSALQLAMASGTYNVNALALGY
jgi:hypothetical protein